MTNQDKIIGIMRRTGLKTSKDLLPHIERELPNISKASAYSTISKIKREGMLDSTPGNVDDGDEYKAEEVPADGYDPRETPELTKMIDAAIGERLNDRFDTLDRTTMAVACERLRGLIVSGAPGVGKTYICEKNILKANNSGRVVSFHSGGVSAVGLYHKLFFHRKKGDILVLDDSDDVFYDDTALNLLKKALDTTHRRVIGWGKQSSWTYNPDFPENEVQSDGEYDEDNKKWPMSFQFDGAVVFITNENILKKSKSTGRMACHYQALISRTLYLDLTLHTVRDRIVRIRQIFAEHMAPGMGLSKADVAELMKFVEANRTDFVDLSLRMMCHLSNLYNVDRKRWKKDARAMLLKPSGSTTEELVEEFLSKEEK